MPNEGLRLPGQLPRESGTSLSLLENIAARIRSSSVSARYGVGLALALLAMLFRFFLYPDPELSLPLITLYPAVLMAAWLGGFGPGVFATFVCALGGYYSGSLPIYSFSFERHGDLIALTLFVMIGGMMSTIIDTLGKTRRTLEERSARLAEESRERARTEERLIEVERAARDAAEAANRTKDQFLAMVSHDLRAPLHAIFGAAQILGRMKLPQKAERILTMIERNANLQARLVQDLIEMSRISTGHLSLNRQPAKVRCLIAGILESMQPRFVERNLNVQWTSSGRDRTLFVDVDRLQQIVTNLITNAVKFTDSGGWIKVHLDESDASRVELTISDSGIGIDPAFLPQLFMPFRQAETRERHEGLGLGLAIVKNLVELHGGSLRVHSDGLGTGSTFVVRLPAIETDNPRSETVPAGPAAKDH